MVKALAAEHNRPAEGLSLLAIPLTVLMGCLLLTSILGVGQALATDYAPPTLRAWQRAHEGHLTIEWSKTARVQQKKGAGQLILRFTEPMAVDISPALKNLSNFVDPIRSSVNGTDLSLVLKPGVSSKVNVREKRIVAVDFTRDPSVTLRSTIETQPIKNGIRLTINGPSASEIDVDRRVNDIRLEVAAGWDIDPAGLIGLQNTIRPWFRGLSVEKGSERTSLSFTLEPQIVSSVRFDGPTRTVIDLMRNPETPSIRTAQSAKSIFIPEKKPITRPADIEAQNAGPPMPRKRPFEADKPEVITASEDKASIKAAEVARPDALRFDWKKPVAAAVFLRAGYLWVVFDEDDINLLSGMPISPAALGPVSTSNAEGGTALRFSINQPISVSVSTTDAKQWQIKTVPSAQPPRSHTIERLDGSEGLRITPSSGTRVVSIIDPAVGDQIDILPARDVGIGQPKKRRFVDVELLSTVQGLAWRPLNDQLTANLHDGSLELRSPNGLSLSQLNPDPSTSAPVIIEAMAKKAPTAETSETNTSPAPLVVHPENKTATPDKSPPIVPIKPDSYFELAGTGVERELVNEYRRIRRQAIRKATPENRDKARLELARLLVSERLATEARTVLSAVSDEADEHVMMQKQALGGVAAFLIGHRSEASSLLLDPELNDDDEIDIWRGALLSLDKRWQTAAERWKAMDSTLDAYPPRLRLDLGLMALQAAIETNNDKMMRRGMRRLSSLPLNAYDQARFDAMKALKAERSGDLEKARALLTGLTDSPNPAIRTLADFELAALALKSTSNNLDLLKALDRQAPLWRGHPEEQSLLDKLARHHVDANAYRKALTIWRRLIQLYPEAADREGLKQARQDIFVRALSDDRGPVFDRIDVYAIYLDFIDLLPGDPEVREVHRHLANHLAELDLLNEGIDVLQSLMTSAETDIDRADIAADIATLMLRQGRDAPALVMLDESQASKPSSLDPSLDEKRALLRAQALARLDRADDALLAIRDLRTASGQRLRAKILWDERRWTRLAATIESYFTDADLTSPLAKEDQELALWLALARQKEQDVSQLIALRKRFGPAMNGSIHAEAFDVATQDGIRTRDIKSFLAATGDQIAELRRFREAKPALP